MLHLSVGGGDQVLSVGRRVAEDGPSLNAALTDVGVEPTNIGEWVAHVTGPHDRDDLLDALAATGWQVVGVVPMKEAAEAEAVKAREVEQSTAAFTLPKSDPTRCVARPTGNTTPQPRTTR